MRGAFAAAAAVLVVGAALTAQAAGPIGTVATIDGRTLNGTFTVDGDNVAAVRAADGEVRLGLDEIASFDAVGSAPVEVEAPHRVWLRSGAELAATALRGLPAGDGKPARLQIELRLGALLELPLTMVQAFRHAGPNRGDMPPSFAGDRRDPPANDDLIFVQKDGKQHRFQVAITGFSADSIDFQLRGEPYDFALAGVLGAVFGKNTGFAADPQSPPRTVVEFDSGDRLAGRLLGLDGELRLRLDEGCELTVPSRRILRLAVESERLCWLSDLQPAAEQTAAFDRVWPWTADRSIAGPGFELGGKSFTRGIGMIPRTRLTYDLGGGYDAFEALIGIDDRGGPQANAVFRVYADGKPVYESTPMTLGREPEPVHVEIAGCQRLAIECDFGQNFDLGDFCVFANARVLRRN
ncbi:MAG: NPCBM/NEW2 domain-containing protein [Planctomycetes bacterium]|nr:NPCBM/NEW2 domain-containing protein [Planctomycetota bacterium]